MAIRVSVIPPATTLGGNAIFDGHRNSDPGPHAPNVHWMDGFAAARRLGRTRGLEFDTADLLPPAGADIVVHMVFPESPDAVRDMRRRNPGARHVLVLLETALGARYCFNPRNHEVFDAILTYDDRLVDHRRYFPLPPKAYDRERIRTGLPFDQRRTACLVGANRPMRRRSGLFVVRKGWHFSFRDWLDYVFCPGELITYRSKLGQACARAGGNSFDIFGDGWELLEETRAITRGVPTGSTLEYMGRYRYYFALENHSHAHSLISERVWDALWGDAVPVYLGNRRIADVVPPGCFVDASTFGSPRELVEWLAAAPAGTWQRMRDAGRAFISGSSVEPFLPDRFAQSFLAPLEHLAGQIKESA